MASDFNPLGLVVVLFGLGLYVLALGKIFNSRMTDAAKGVWVLVVFLIPVFGLLLTLAFIPPDNVED